MEIENINIEKLIPYVNNPRKNNGLAVDKVAASIQEFGFKVPLVIDKDNTIITGHTRMKAAKKLGLNNLPCVRANDLSKAQVKAFRIADNKVAEYSEWDMEMLDIELKELLQNEYDLGLTGLESKEIEDVFDDIEEEESSYTEKIGTPIYEPSKIEKPKIEEMLNDKKSKELKNKIKTMDLEKDLEEFLLLAAERHNIFDYENIAEFYSHSREEVQEIMEDLALVIIDFEKAIENGYVNLAEEVAKRYKKEKL